MLKSDAKLDNEINQHCKKTIKEDKTSTGIKKPDV